MFPNAHERLLLKLGSAGEAARFLGGTHVQIDPLPALVRGLAADEFAILEAVVSGSDPEGHDVYRNDTLGSPPHPVRRLLSRFIGASRGGAPGYDLDGGRPSAKGQIEAGIASSDFEAFAALRAQVAAEKLSRASAG
jgi:hypothetical protein